MGARGPLQTAFYRLCNAALKGPVLALTSVRYFDVPDVRAMPGGLLLVSNHQSFLDPVLVALAVNEPLFFLAREDLFDLPLFSALIWALGARPVARGRVDVRALKTVLRLLRAGGKVLMFPEGTRTRDGALGRFKSGVAAIAVRSGVPVLPVCVEGAFGCWPRTRRLPRPGRVAVAYGTAIRPDGESTDELNMRIRGEVGRLQAFLRRYLEGDRKVAGREVSRGGP